MDIIVLIIFGIITEMLLKNTLIFLIVIGLLLKFTAIDKWWLCFFAALALLTKFGFTPGIIWLAVAMIILKVVKDIYSVTAKS